MCRFAELFHGPVGGILLGNRRMDIVGFAPVQPYADAALGLTVQMSGRYLVAHEDGAYREWGASASVRIDPGAPGRGLTLSVMPSWAATGGPRAAAARRETRRDR